MTQVLDIGGRLVGPEQPCFVVAEVAQNHDGSLGMAHAFVDAVADAGVDAVKFQTHITAEETTPAEPFRVAFSRQDATRYDYWKRTEFRESEWLGLANHARDRGLVFLSTPFSDRAVEWLLRCDVPAWKISSGEAATPQLLSTILDTGLPVILSTGMSTMSEIRETVASIAGRGVPYAVLQCTSRYPTPPEQVGLNVMEEFRSAFGCPVGLSDHSGTIYAGLASVALGADILEVHATFSRSMFGPDVVVSLPMDELRTLAEGVRFISRMRSAIVDKDLQGHELREMREIFFKSVVAARPLEAGTALASDDLTVKKPGTGIPAKELESLLGRRLRVPVEADEQLSLEDLD